VAAGLMGTGVGAGVVVELVDEIHEEASQRVENNIQMQDPMAPHKVVNA
jgi:hypothetical protein